MGIEPDSGSALLINDLQESTDSLGTFSGTLQDEIGSFPLDLQAIIQHWPALPEDSKAEIMAIIRTAQGGSTQ